MLKVRMTLTAENAPLEHVIEAEIDLGKERGMRS